MFVPAASNPCRVSSTFATPFAANAAAIECRSAGKLTEAIAIFRQAVEQFPNAIVLHQNLAQSLYEAGDVDGAIAEQRRVLAIDARNVPSHFALYELLQIKGDRVMALAHQRLALEEQRLFSHVATQEQRSVLVLFAPGDWQANIPVDFLFDNATTTVHKLYLLDERYLRKDPLPRYDVLWNAIAETPDSHGVLEFAERIINAQDRPALNNPRAVMATARTRLPDTLRHTDAHVPHVVEILDGALSNGETQFDFPVIVRPAGSHAGAGLERLEDASACAGYVRNNPANTYYVSRFVDYASTDGYFRKYRIVFVDGAPYPVHLAVSPNWMIHYYNAPMSEHAWMRAEEAAFLADLRSVFDGARYETLEALARAIGLEYFGIDCAIDRDGRVLVFEADPAMLVHTSDPIELYPYKHQYIPRIYRAVEAMLDRRKTADM